MISNTLSQTLQAWVGVWLLDRPLFCRGTLFCYTEAELGLFFAMTVLLDPLVRCILFQRWVETKLEKMPFSSCAHRIQLSQPFQQPALGEAGSGLPLCNHNGLAGSGLTLDLVESYHGPAEILFEFGSWCFTVWKLAIDTRLFCGPFCLPGGFGCPFQLLQLFQQPEAWTS